MKIKAAVVDYPQGSEAWKRHRAQSLNASELATAMGLSKYKTRAQLIVEKATGIVPEVDAETQRRFDRGHEFEAVARPWGEEIVGDMLYPTVLSAEVESLSRPMSASLDGQDLMPDHTREHKTLNAALAASLDAGVIPDEYHPQMEQGLMLSGASRCLFMASNGDRDSMRFAWYESNPELRAKIIPTWQQFEADVAAYAPPAAVAPIAVAQPVQALPAVVVRVTGEIAISDNFAVFQTRLQEFIDRELIREPKTDEDFATLDHQIKAMKGAEAALEAAEEQMLAQIATVDTAKKTKDMLSKLVRDNRLMAEKLLAAEKERRKAEIVSAGVASLREHVKALTNRVAVQITVAADFPGVIKGKKSLTSMEDAISTELARAKIEANRIADLIDANRAAMDAADAAGLFPDFASVCTKPADDFANLIASRRAAAQVRLEQERERIRKEEADRLEREAAARQAQLEREQRAAAEQKAREEAAAQAAAARAVRQEESKRIDLERDHAAAERTSLVDYVPQPAPAPEVRTFTAAPAMNEAPTLTLGEIKARIAPLSIDAAGLEALGFPFTRVKASCMYRESAWPEMHAAMVKKLLAAGPQRQAA
jgi:putative phage-type endonuclease